jgi:hypothetical protein
MAKRKDCGAQLQTIEELGGLGRTERGSLPVSGFARVSEKTKWILIAVLFLTPNLVGPCAAQGMASRRSALTNKDIVTLAKAGFDEDFVIDAIARSRKEFDTSADALAALAAEGVTQRIARAMLDSAPSASKAETKGAEVTPQAPDPQPSLKASEKASAKKQPKQPKPTPIGMAIGANMPYSESRSAFWGMLQKKVEVGASATRSENAMALHMGTAYAGVLASAGKAR